MKKGISLISLVIVIIVMIILAGLIIISLNNSGIFEKAKEARDKTNLNNAKSAASIAWAEAYADGNTTEEDLEKAVIQKLEKMKIYESDFLIRVSKTGVEVYNKGNWSLEKDSSNKNTKITNSKTSIDIGDIVDYIATGTTYEDTWKVLGVTKSGNVLLVANRNMGNITIGSDNPKTALESYNNAISTLNSACEKYGKGTGALYARSINVDDVNIITGYNPLNTGVYDPDWTGVGTAYYAGELYQYGNVVSYKWADNETYPYYTSYFHSTAQQMKTEHPDGFYYVENGKRLNSKYSENTEILTIYNTIYNYYPVSLIATSMYSPVNGIERNGKIFNMLFLNTNLADGEDYFLASKYVGTHPQHLSFGIRKIMGGRIEHDSIIRSTGLVKAETHGYRAVVVLDSNVNLTLDEDTGHYKIS